VSAGARGVAVLVAYYVPPAVGIASQRMTGIIRHLPEMGWDPVVVAPRSAHYHLDPASADALEGVRVVRTPNPEPSRWLRRMVGGRDQGAAGGGAVREVRSATDSPVGAVLQRAVRNWLYVPDAQLLWIPWAAAAAARVLAAQGRGRSVLFSSSVPFSAHFAARRAARRAGVPWVAEYRDPWSVAPPQFGTTPALRQVLNRRLDHDIVSSASAVVVTSEGTARRYDDVFGEAIRGGLHVVRNGFDGVGQDAAPGPHAPLRLVYSGTLLSPSYAAPLLRALARLWDASPGSVFLDVFGPAEGWRAAGGRDGSFLRLHGLVPADEMPGHLASASALVLLQPDEAHAQYIAGKLYEYLGARRPVLAALPPECEARTLILRHGELWSMESLDEPSCFAVLSRLGEAHRAGLLQGPRVEAERVEPLSRRAQVAGLARIFDELVRR